MSIYAGYTISESKIINSKDIYYNKDKFDNGEINLCFITGFSGSGKTTMSKNIDNAEIIELDDIIANYNFSDENLKEYGDAIYKFFSTTGKKYRIDIPEIIKNMGGYFYSVTKDFCNFMMSYSKSHKNTKYIVEGIELYTFLNPDTLPFKNYAVYIKGTSKLVSSYRATKRNVKNDKDAGENVKISDKIKMFMHQFDSEADKYFEKWYKYFSKLNNNSNK